MKLALIILAAQLLGIWLFSLLGYAIATPETYASWLAGLITMALGVAIVVTSATSEEARRFLARTVVLWMACAVFIIAMTAFVSLRAWCVVWPTTAEEFDPKYVYFPLRLQEPFAKFVREKGGRQAAVDRYHPLAVKRNLDAMPGIERERTLTAVAFLSLYSCGATGGLVLLLSLVSSTLTRIDLVRGTVTAQRRFKVALSFAGGPNRKFVEDVAEYLARELGRRDIFYDNWLTAFLSRTNLHDYLTRIYARQSDLVVPFLDAEYERREWCRIEWRAIRTLIDGRQHDRVMPIRLDDAPIPGLLPTDGYIRKLDQSAQQIAQLVIERFRSLPAVLPPPDS